MSVLTSTSALWEKAQTGRRRREISSFFIIGFSVWFFVLYIEVSTKKVRILIPTFLNSDYLVYLVGFLAGVFFVAGFLGAAFLAEASFLTGAFLGAEAFFTSTSGWDSSEA